MSDPRSRRRVVLGGAASLLGLALVLTGCNPPEDQPTTATSEPIVQGETRTIASGETHALTLELSAGTFVRLAVEQRGIDLLVRLRDPRGEEIARVDSPNGERGPEELVVLIGETGPYLCEVVAPDGKEDRGEYVLSEREERPASARDRAWVAADRRYHRARATLRSDPQEAIPVFRELIATWTRLGLPMQKANTRVQLFQAYRAVREPQTALAVGERAVEGYRSLGAVRPLAVFLQALGKTYLATGNLELAVERLDEARALLAEQDDPCSLIATLSPLGLAHHRLGHLQTALGLFTRARRMADRCDKPLYRAFLLTETALAFLDLQRSDDAVEALERAGEIYREDDGGHPERYTTVLRNLAEAAIQTGELDLAERSIRQALGRYHGDQKRSLAGAYNTLGTVLRERGDLSAARRAFETALELARESADPRSEAVVLNGLGHLHTLDGEPEQGLEHHDAALAIVERIGDTGGQTTSLARGAQALGALDRFDAAWQRLAPALDHIEARRDAAGQRDHRLAYFSVYQEYYELACDISLGLYDHQPSAELFSRAVQLNEHRLTRELTDHLLLKASADDAASVAGGETAPGSLPLDLAAIRERILDPRSLLLIYALGEERSHLLAVSSREERAHTLPERRVLEELAGDFAAGLLETRERSQQQRAELGLELANHLLAPVADLLAHAERLVLIPSGELQIVPFAALPPPGGDVAADRFLIQSHEIVNLPSLSTFYSLRRIARRRPPPQGAVALFADPVFSAADPRVEAAFRAPAPSEDDAPDVLTRSAQELGIDPWRRLESSRREAEAIRERLAPDTVFLATDFAASRDTFLTTALDRYRVLHLATHAVLHPQGERSGIVLSLVDAAGRPQDGFVTAFEISQLDLPLDLVVLSACQTGLGRIVRGEGTLGLAWSFFHAGSSRVIASLWRVGDERTAELMRHFYAALLGAGEPPAAALRSAQLAMLRRPGSRPHDWAAFVFQGEWNDAARR